MSEERMTEEEIADLLTLESFGAAMVRDLPGLLTKMRNEIMGARFDRLARIAKIEGEAVARREEGRSAWVDHDDMHSANAMNGEAAGLRRAIEILREPPA